MVKVALLIGVSEYGSGLNPLPSAVRDVEIVQQVLQPSEMGGFDEVKCLPNPNPPVMREAIETLFSDRTENDCVLLFFSGHIVQDEVNELYLATSITCKNPRTELMRVSAISTGFLQELMSNSPCQQQVVILDCCLDSLSSQGVTIDHHVKDIKTQLGGKRRVIVASITPSLNSFDAEAFNHSIYTRYLAEAIRTGAADLDSDGWISVEELHEYASGKVQVVTPVAKSVFYSADHHSKIILSKAPIDDPKLKYRKQVEHSVNRGEISESSRNGLNKFAESLHLSSQVCTLIEGEVLKPYQEYQEKLQRYERQFRNALHRQNPLSYQERETLWNLQHFLGLRDSDVAPIEDRITSRLANISDVEDEPNQPTESETQSDLNSLPIMPSIAMPEFPPTSSVEATRSTPAVNLPSSWANLDTSPPAASKFPNKFFLPIAIGGTLVTVAIAMSLLARTPVKPPAEPSDNLSSSPDTSPTLSAAPSPADKTPSPSPSASPEPKVCTALINGNLRSEPAAFRENVIEYLRGSFPVTTKQTQG
ncbi:MAG TPA: caspase family protein, partial [Cyanophyceae cyanobacterium]